MELSYTSSLVFFGVTGFFLKQVLKESVEKQTKKSVHKSQCSVCFVKPGTVLVFDSEHMP